MRPSPDRAQARRIRAELHRSATVHRVTAIPTALTMPASTPDRLLLGCLLLLTLVLALPAAAIAQVPAVASAPLEEVEVTGEQPGPGLWRIRDGEHDLWVLGTLAPLPERFEWRSPQVDHVLARAEAILAPPQATVSVSALKGLLLLPGWLRARHLPDGQTLATVLPGPVYAHWSDLRAKYLKDDRGNDRLRPAVAAEELYRRAASAAGLRSEDVAWQRLRKQAGDRHLVITPVTLDTALSDPGTALRQWAGLPPQAEAQCLSATLDRVERDVSLMRQRARQWAIGDVAGLRGSVGLDVEADAPCLAIADGIDAIGGPLRRLRTRIDDAWVDAATTLLAAHGTSLAVLPIGKLLEPDGVLARLRERGFEVTAPD